MRIPLLSLLILVAGCSTGSRYVHLEEPQGQIFASIRQTASAFGGPVTANTGYFFYADYSRTNSGQPHVTAVEYRNGKIVDVVGGSSFSSIGLMEDLTQIGFQPFDYTSEMDRAYEALREESDSEFWVTMDGWTWEIFISTEAGDFRIEDGNPNTDIYNLAPHSSDFAKLKAYLDRLFLYYGAEKIGF